MLIDTKVSYLGPKEELTCAICGKLIIAGDYGIQVIMGRIMYDLASQEMALTYETDSITHRDCKIMAGRKPDAKHDR